MIWLTWRQFRAQSAVAFAALAMFAAVVAITGPNLASLYAASGVGSCQGSGCRGVADNLLGQLDAGTYPLLYMLGIAVVLIVPALIGLFWGAPLVAREFETGTHHLVWNQSITRGRWLAVKLSVIGLAAMAVTEGLSLMLAWWAMPISWAVEHGGTASRIAMNQFSPIVFASHGITPLAYAAFAFALGVTAGALIRNTLPAMAITLALFTALQIAMALWIRPHLFPPDRIITTFSSISDIGFTQSAGPSSQGTFTFTAGALASEPGAWVLASSAVDAAGNPVSNIPTACMHPAAATPDAAMGSTLDCLDRQGIRVSVTYQPASRYWAFQWTETAVYLALAVALAGYCFLRISRRLS